jgi:hypothetical protein
METPSNHAPILMCEGICAQPTKHLYVEGRPGTALDGKQVAVPIIRHYFACIMCKRERVYGAE